MNVVLIGVSLVVDAIALSAVLFRIGSLGLTPNKAAALGENIILLIDLAVLLVLYLGFLRRRIDFQRLLAWQMGYLPVFASWAAVVVFVFPLVFRV